MRNGIISSIAVEFHQAEDEGVDSSYNRLIIVNITHLKTGWKEFNSWCWFLLLWKQWDFFCCENNEISVIVKIMKLILLWNQIDFFCCENNDLSFVVVVTPHINHRFFLQWSVKCGNCCCWRCHRKCKQYEDMKTYYWYEWMD